MTVLTIAYVIQLALFGAAGTQFVRAHLEAQAVIRKHRRADVAKSWRLWRHPHLRARDHAFNLDMLRAARGNVWGLAFLAAAPLAPLLARLFLSPNV